MERIETERLVIRPFQHTDWPGVREFMPDPRATRYLAFTDAMETEQGAHELFDATMAAYATAEPMHAYAIALGDGMFIGSCGVSSLPEPRILECFYGLLPRFWKQGYASEAATALLSYCMEASDTQEIRAYVSEENPASSRVAERIGMENFGMQPHPVFGREDLVYAAVRGRWPGTKRD